MLLPLTLIAGGIAAYFFLMDDSTGTEQNPAGGGSNESGWTALEQAAAVEYRGMMSPADRIKKLEWVATQEWARADHGLLRQALITDLDDSVRVRALQLSLKLATKKNIPHQQRDVIRTGMSSERQAVTMEALDMARQYPAREYIADLKAIADSDEEYRFKAIDALAFIDDAEAKAAVLERAMDDDAPKAERIRAIALLHQTKDSNAKSYLEAWAKGGDAEIAEVAREALKGYAN
ncbi:MAG: hypothetical protein HUU29_10110 [Planctomycetaceae bacterium]|nr:hypothetical protein [Planctomycetaceae bacterium]